jgi:CRISPR-associated protein Cas1
LIHPFSVEELTAAWERVLENEGCAGADGITVERFAREAEGRIGKLRDLVAAGEYRPFPLLAIVVEKQAGKKADSKSAAGSKPAPQEQHEIQSRTLLVPAVRDRILQTAAARLLSRSFEEEFLECSFAYRPGRSVDRAIARIRELHWQGYEFVVDADIQAFFDNVEHDLLFERLAPVAEQEPGVADLMRLWVRAEVWDGRTISPLRKGLPQGSPISPLLANYFLEDFDRELEQSGRKLVRYADDFLILSKSRAEAEDALGRTKEVLSTLHLDFNWEKTQIVDFEEGFRFLGAYFHGDDIWTPWKNGKKPHGRILFMAHPMPERLRMRYERPFIRTAMAEALEKTQGPEVRSEGPTQGERSLSVAFLYLTQQGSVLRKTGDRLLVEKDDEILLDLPYHKLEHVLLFGNIQVTTQAMAELLDKGVPVSLFSRQGNYRGALTPARGKNVELRVHQFEAYRDAVRALALAKAAIHAKLENALEVLEEVRARHESPEGYAAKRAAILDGLSRVEEVKTVAELDGVEGASARAYFDALMLFNRSDFTWQGRSRHPALDPINALLSFAYTLLTHEVSALLEGAGLDPYLGFLHQLDYGRPSLALDVIEPFRHPAADRLVLRLLNLRVLAADDFETRAGRAGVWLTPAALIRFFEHYERWMMEGKPSMRERLKRDVEGMAHCLRSGEAPRPYRMKEPEDKWSTSSVTI